MRRVALFLGILVLSGCASRQTGPYATSSESARSPLEAQRLTFEALDVIDSQPANAEQLLRDALTADLYHGPAHNNLGVLYFEQGKLYEAANEFEWARKLMPGNPDPRMNLALTLERAGRIDEALKGYATALEVREGHIPTIQAMTRCQLRHGRETSETKLQLQEIALRGETKEWRSWAQERLLRASNHR